MKQYDYKVYIYVMKHFFTPDTSYIWLGGYAAETAENPLIYKKWGDPMKIDGIQK